MAFQSLREVVGLGFRAAMVRKVSTDPSNKVSVYDNSRGVPVVPDLQQIVTSAGDESPLLTRSGIRANQAARGGSRCPADRVHAHAVCVEDLVGPAIVSELENADMPVRRGAGQETATLMRSPRNHIH